MRYEESLTAGSDSDRKRLASRNPVKAILCLSEESWGKGERGWRMGWLMDSEDLCVCVCVCVCVCIKRAFCELHIHHKTIQFSTCKGKWKKQLKHAYYRHSRNWCYYHELMERNFPFQMEISNSISKQIPSVLSKYTWNVSWMREFYIHLFGYRHAKC